MPEFFRRCDEERVPDAINALLGRFADNYTLSALYDHTEEGHKYMLCQFLPQGIAVPPRSPFRRIASLKWD